MTDEKFIFVSDVAEKKRIGRSAYNKRSHTGKGGSVKLPSDFMSRKEKEAMNGECKSYKLNSPMSYAEFKAMPQDLQIAYIKQLRKAYGAPDSEIAKMLGVSQNGFCTRIKNLGLNRGKNAQRLLFDKDAWYAWLHGLPAKVMPKTEPTDEPEADIPAEQPSVEAVEECAAETPAALKMESASVPYTGSMIFKGNATEALATVARLLGDGNFQIHITWTERNA